MNYEIHDQELLVIVKFFCYWWYYLESLSSSVTVLTDHDSLQYFETAKNLSQRQIRWTQRLTAFWFKIKYQKSLRNSADESLQRSDYANKLTCEDIQSQKITNRLQSILILSFETDVKREKSAEHEFDLVNTLSTLCKSKKRRRSV